MCRFHIWCQNTYHCGCRKQFFLIYLFHPKSSHIAFRYVWITGNQFKSKGCHFPCKVLCNSSKSQESISCISASANRNSPILPLIASIMHLGIIEWKISHQHHRICCCLICHLIQAIIWNISYNHSMFICCIHIYNIYTNSIPCNDLTILQLLDCTARNFRILLDDCVCIRGFFRKCLSCVVFQPDNLRPNRFQYTFFDLIVGIIIITDIYLKFFSHVSFSHLSYLFS